MQEFDSSQEDEIRLVARDAASVDGEHIAPASADIDARLNIPVFTTAANLPSDGSEAEGDVAYVQDEDRFYYWRA